MRLNINTDAAVVYTNKLEKLHRSGLPRAIRETLNGAALDVKKKTMPESARRMFDDRTNTNFFKANSRVKFASGFNTDKMEAVIGFVDTKLKGANNQAVDDLEQQELGGIIKGRAFVPLKKARVANNFKRVTRRKFRIADIKQKVIDAKKVRGSSAAERFTKAAIFAGPGRFVIGTNITGKGNRILFGVRKIMRTDGNTVIAKDPLFAVKGGRQVKVKATGFMKVAAMKSSKKMEQLYIENAKDVIKFLKNK